MLIYFFIIFLLYYFFILLMIYGWNHTGTPVDHPDHMDLSFISVIIAVRNEEENLPRLLDCLSMQNFPSDRFEVVFIDDSSTDHTVKVIEQFMASVAFSIRILANNYVEGIGISPKKAALQKGIEASQGTILVMTDGDCWFGADWLKTISASFYNEKTMFVSGPVAIHGDHGILSRIQSVELSSLIGTGAALINLNYPLMCNGANLAFRKTAFSHVNGYEGYAHQTSGDDVFLMQKINHSFPESILFLNDANSLVYANPQPSLSGLINQRKRWASKWSDYLLPFSWALPVFLFVHYTTFFVALVVLFPGFSLHLEIGVLIGIKIILDYIFLKKVMNFCKLPFRLWVFILSEFLYPIYALFIGISVHFGTYSWKGRVHKA